MRPATLARLFEGFILLAAERALSLYRFWAIEGLAKDGHTLDRPTRDIGQHSVDKPTITDGIAPHRPPPTASEANVGLPSWPPKAPSQDGDVVVSLRDAAADHIRSSRRREDSHPVRPCKHDVPLAPKVLDEPNSASLP
jgi:hypothetical protein